MAILLTRVFKKSNRFRSSIQVFLIFIFSFSILSFQAKQANAMDRKVLLVFKTAGYGAAAGFLVGAATWTLGIGSSRNLFKGASLGLCAGIGLGIYVLATQDERDARDRNQHPWQPRQPVGPDDWKNEPEDPADTGGQMRLEYQRGNIENYFLTEVNKLGQPQEVKFWMPLTQVNLN